MDHTVYALYSPDYDKIYIGRTSNFEQRLISHNEKGTKGWTVKFRPWKVVFTEHFQTKEEAIRREKQLKKSRGRAMCGKKWMRNSTGSSPGSYPSADRRRFPSLGGRANPAPPIS